jgi:poly(beta-D-mannuronate) lyase
MMKTSPRFCALLLLCLAAVTLCQSQKLRSPWDGKKIKLTNAGHICPDPPAFSETLSVDGYYLDKNHSIVDPSWTDASSKDTQRVIEFGQAVSSAADSYITKGSPAGPACVYTLLTAAAKAKAWTGTMPFPPGVYVQHWVLSGAAMAYLKVRNSRIGKPEDDKLIQEWFRALAIKAREYLEAHRTDPASQGLSNHTYWTGLALAAEGIANDDRSAFDWGMDAYRTGVREIQPDGTLPFGMSLGASALEYHLYAAGPLVMLAELGEANKIDLYAESDGALQKLVKRATDGVMTPQFFEQKTGIKQTMPIQISANEIGWAVPYVQRFPNGTISAQIQQARTVRLWQWGGLPPE